MSQVRTALPVASLSCMDTACSRRRAAAPGVNVFQQSTERTDAAEAALCAAVDRWFACAPLPAAALAGGAAGLEAPTPPTLPVVQRTAARTAPTLTGRTSCAS